MSLAAVKLSSPFHHCRLCTKVYSSEKSLNKHLRKKHADARPRMKDQSSGDLANLDSGSSDDRLPKCHDLLTLSVPLVARSGLGLGGSGRRPPIEEDVVIVCPECNGTIKSKKGVAKHYMCFHNAVYAAWKSSWFGRSVRLMDLTREMISEFYASGGTHADKISPAATADAGAAVQANDAAKYRSPHGREENLPVGIVLDSVDEAEDAESNLSGRSPKPDASKELGRHGQVPASATFRPKRSKLKTQMATTAPFFTNKDGKLEFNTNENPLDINCPFCITHKTTIKGLAKHCVNHHPTEYADWKNGKFGSVQLRYVRPNSSFVNQTLGELRQQKVSRTIARKPSPLPSLAPQLQSGSPSVAGQQNQLNTMIDRIFNQPVKPEVLDANLAATGRASSSLDDRTADDAAVDDSGSATSVAGAGKEKPSGSVAAGLNLFEDDKQATPCPFCGELIFSKGMGKHCIYFHHDQYQEWKSGKFGSVPLRFVPNQVGGDASELSERALKRREARKKNGISITLPLTEAGSSSGLQAATPTHEASGAEVTVRIKPSVLSGEVHKCDECGREFDKSSSLSQHLRIHKYGPSMSKHGFQTQATWDDDTEESSVGSDLSDYEAATFVCHYCEAIFDSAEGLKLHFDQKHREDAINERRSLFVLGVASADERTAADYSGETVVIQTERAVRYVCDICHSQHRTKRGLGRHYRGHQLEKFSSVLFDDSASGRRAEADGDSEAEMTETNEGAESVDEQEREPGELSPRSALANSVARPNDGAHHPERHFCSVCKSCFPSARSLAQHYRVHKFGSASRGATTPGASAAAAAATAEAPALILDGLDGEDSDSDEELNGEGSGRLQISDAGDLSGAEDAVDATARSKDAAESPAGCPKCRKVFRSGLFLRDHFRRCFARALAEGELEMRDLEGLAGIVASPDGTKADCDRETDEADNMIPSPGGSGKTAASAIGSGDKLPFECPLCSKSFSTQANLVKHNVMHTGTSVSCKACLREFKMPCHLARHYCSASPPEKQQCQPRHQQRQLPAPSDTLETEGNHQCDLCNRTFLYSGNLTMHRRLCEKLQQNARPEQSESDDSQQQMILLDCEDEVHECNLCNETFADRLSLERHTQDCSLKPAVPAITVAATTLVMAAAPRVGSSGGNGGVVGGGAGGGTGGSGSGNGAQLFQRERIPCPNCGKTYCRKDVLEAHLKTSCRGVPPAIADASPGAGPQPMKRPRHDANRAAGSAERSALTFRCELCASQFSSSLGLVVHRSKCHPQFYGPSNRRAATAAATPVGEEQLFECSACQRRFVRASQLEKHRFMCPPYIRASAAAGEAESFGEQGPLLSLPNRCLRCPRAFLTVGRLQEHLRTVHSCHRISRESPSPEEQQQQQKAATVPDAATPATDDDGELKVDGGLLLDDADVADDETEAQATAAALDDGCGAMDVEYPGADAYLCSECDRSYPTFELLNHHLMEAHEIDAVTPELPAPDAVETARNLSPEASAIGVATAAAVLHPLQLTAAITGARKRKSTPVSMC